ncbi:TraR/DksA family transcriptional regulator [Candidatus Parcubacteria bacterium]|nr:TraR/DksA family transcriptional regulator [Candidatus Parcubacteria bacterium]
MSDNKPADINIDSATIKEIKQGLIKRKEQINKDLADIFDASGDGDSKKVKFPDFGDKTDENAQEIGEYSTNLATDKVLESSLRDIDNALKRIEDNSYGICKYCKKAIGKKRLLARPVASACIECKTKLQSLP